MSKTERERVSEIDREREREGEKEGVRDRVREIGRVRKIYRVRVRER